MANFSIKFFTTIIYFGALFLPGLFSHPDTEFPGPYLTGDPVKFYETDPVTKQVISYDIVPFSSSSSHSREKRQVILPNDDKALFSKQVSPTKKPTDLEVKPNSPEVHIWANKTLGSEAQTQSTSTSFTVSTHERVVSVVPTADSKLLGNAGVIPVDNVGNLSVITSTSTHTVEDVSKSESPNKVNLEDEDVYPDAWETKGIEKYKDKDWMSKHNYSEFQLNETHKYYNSIYLQKAESYYIDLDKDPTAEKHQMLSNAYRRAATIKLTFDFPFYGHLIKNVTVATGGFVYLGDQVHAWLAATQYVAPLMANFDSSTSDNATVSTLSTDNFFIVEWKHVHLQDSQFKGPFTFQTTLYKNGTIVFAYKEIPVPIREINDTMHPVKVGLSDAYIRDRTMLFVKQKTIYEYHRIDLKEHENYVIENGTAIVFTPNPSCPSFKTCEVCTQNSTEQFDCAWCPSLGRCSDGTDRGRQDWVNRGCDKEHSSFKHTEECSSPWASTTVSTYQNSNDPRRNSIHHDDDMSHHSDAVHKVKAPESQGMGTAGVIGVLFLVMLVFGAVGWAFYAYLYPHSPSGQLLIRYRPTQWAFRRGEARYTAASIHM